MDSAQHPTVHRTEEEIRGAEVGTLLVSLGFVGGAVASRNCEGHVGMDSEPVHSCNAPVWGVFLLLMALWPLIILRGFALAI